jgi:hypothetical protein
MSFPMPPAVITQEYPLASNTHYDLADRRIVVANDAYPAGALRARGIANVSLRFEILDGAIFSHATWTEHSHLLLLENVVNARIEQVDFQNPIGDAILLFHDHEQLGAGCDGVKILGCTIAGNANNRNGISVVHARNVEIANNRIAGMARPDMPGAIDLEPNVPTDEVVNIWIHHNIIEGGSAHGIQLWNGIAHARIGEILIEDNVITGPREIGIWCSGSSQVAEGPVTIRRNTITGARQPVVIENMVVDWDGAGDGDGLNRRKHRKKRQRHRGVL